jgi:hypothetical protein
VRHEREVSGCPRRAVLNGALEQTRGDLLSLRGVFAIAVVLALATEIFPDGDRVAVAVAALIVLALVDVAQRLAHYLRRSERMWRITTTELAHLLSFAIEPLSPGALAPFPVTFVIRTPDGRYIQPLARRVDPLIPRYPPGTRVHIVEQPYERGIYEVRVYAPGPRWIEMARATLNVQ